MTELRNQGPPHVANLAGTADEHPQYVRIAPAADTRNVVQPTTADVKALVLKGASGQSDNFLELQDSAGAALAAFSQVGYLGIGIAPTARLHLAAGGTASGSAPLRFASGSLLTTPEAGVMEFDGTGIYLTPTNHRRFISLASDSIIAAATATAATPTTLWTGIINANELKAQRVYMIKGCGLLTTHDANDQAIISIKLGAATIVTLTTPKGLATNAPWEFEAFFTVRTIGTSGTVSAHGCVESTTGDVHTVTASAVVNTEIASTATVVVQWTDVSNSLTLEQCWMATAD